MRLTITIASLERGQHIELKSLDELLAAEDAIMEACRTLRAYLETAATFDGREVLFDFSTEEPTVIAQAPGADHLSTIAPLPSYEETPPVPSAPGGTVEEHTGTGGFRTGNGVQEYLAQSRERWAALTPGQQVGIVLGVILLLILLFRI